MTRPARGRSWIPSISPPVSFFGLGRRPTGVPPSLNHLWKLGTQLLDFSVGAVGEHPRVRNESGVAERAAKADLGELAPGENIRNALEVRDDRLCEAGRLRRAEVLLQGLEHLGTAGKGKKRLL